MIHQFSFWQQGISPFEHASSSSGDGADTTFSHRMNAWSAACLFNSVLVSFAVIWCVSVNG